MSRLQTIRTYFVERFFATLVSDPAMATLRHPAELFDAQGHFAVPADLGGFVRIPGFANLEQRIAAAPAGQECDDLTKFLQIMRRAYNQITGGLDEIAFADAQAAVARFAPIVRHPDDQVYFPAAVDQYLNFQDGTLTARFDSSAGQSALSGRVYDLLFENPAVPAASNLPMAPYVSRVPFVATVGLGTSGPGYPATPLSAGKLDLGASDVRLTPGRLPPTLYAEVKRLPGAIVLNRLYNQAAQMPGRFSALRNNRLHLDPLASAAGANRPADRNTATVGGDVPPATGPVMIVYHGFYPVDDTARRRPTVGATDREFHHLAMGVLVATGRDQNHQLPRTPAAVSRETSYVFACGGPDLVRMFPIDHPFLTKVNDHGQPDPNGFHVVIYSVMQSPSGWTYGDQPSDGNKSLIQDSVAKDAPFGGRLLGGFTVVLIGAGIGLAFGPVGALVGAAIALVVYVVISLFCLLFGCGSHDNDQFQQSPAFDPPSSGNTFTLSSSNDLSPAGVSQPSGGATPSRTFDLRLIPHFYDRNLYGLLASGNNTLKIVDNASDQETLAWHAFPAGIGYQFDRAVPGAIDISGSSIRNYFDLFLRKLEEVNEAQGAVTYFS